jgi:GNAT superfamily N-acetyltransferase
MGSPERTRRVTREEWERVRDLRLRALADAPYAFGSTLDRERSLGRPEWIAWIEGWEGATNAMFVAERGDRWIGTAVGSRTGEEADAHLYGMWVDPTWRGARVGARLVEGGPRVGAVVGRALGDPGGHRDQRRSGRFLRASGVRRHR